MPCVGLERRAHKELAISRAGLRNDDRILRWAELPRVNVDVVNG
jgi:hypothetical protein